MRTFSGFVKTRNRKSEKIWLRKFQDISSYKFRRESESRAADWSGSRSTRRKYYGVL